MDKTSKRDQRAVKRNRAEDKEKACNTSISDDMEEYILACDGTVNVTNVTTVTDLRCVLNKKKREAVKPGCEKNG